MALFRKKPDPIREREEKLRSQLAAVEAQIQKLNAEVAQAAAEPRLRSTAQPHGGPTPVQSSPGPLDLQPTAASPPGNPFHRRAGQAHLNERGVAKYDLVGNLRRWWRGWRGRRSRNPQLVTYLAAGSIQGLPALRHEKRVARNRFFLLFAVTLVLLWGAFYYWLHNQP